jgi:hypothetical protein
MMRTNRDALLITTVAGEVSHPVMPSAIYDVTHDGLPQILPGMGGAAINARVGDSAFAHATDHLEPGVSARHPDDRHNTAFTLLASIGNPARVVSGEAKGATGVVTGKHGGIDHVMIDFSGETLERLLPGDRIAIRACGAGLTLEGAGDVRAFNVDPDFLERMGIELSDGFLNVAVARTIPAAVMGSGLGRATVARGDYDIQTFDDVMAEQYGLRELRLGDIVAIADADNSYGRIYRSGAVSIGVVAHGRSQIAGHGPGVTTILTSATGTIRTRVDAKANVADVLSLR